MGKDRAPGELVEGMKVSDSYLTELANNIAQGSLNKSAPEELTRHEEDIENIVKNAKLWNAAYKRQIGDNFPDPYSHLIRTGAGIVKEIKLLQDKYLEGKLGVK